MAEQGRGVRATVEGYPVDGPHAFAHRGRTLLHARIGDGRTTLVLVHGMGLGADSLHGLTAALVHHARVHPVELPGFGRTPAQATLRRITDHVEVLTAFLQDRFAGPVVLVGHSMGTAVSAELAVRHPELVERLVLIAPVNDPAARTPARQGVRFLHEAFREPMGTVATVLREYTRSGVRRYLETLPDVLRFDMDHAAASIAQPTLLLRGERDPISPHAWCARLAGRFPDGRLREVDGAAHLAMHSHPEQVAVEIGRFLRAAAAA